MKSTAQKNARKGGLATLKKYGPEHFSEIARKMHRKRRRLEKLANKSL